MKHYLLFFTLVICTCKGVAAQGVFSSSRHVLHYGYSTIYNTRMSIPQEDRPVLVSAFKDSLPLLTSSEVLYPSAIATTDTMARFALALIDLDTTTYMQKKVIASSTYSFTASELLRVGTTGYRIVLKTMGNLYTSLGRANGLREPIRNNMGHYELLLDNTFNVTRIRCLTQVKTYPNLDEQYYEKKTLNLHIDNARNRMILAEKIEVPTVGTNGTDSVFLSNGHLLTLGRQTPTTGTWYTYLTSGSYICNLNLTTGSPIYTKKFWAKGGATVSSTQLDGAGNLYVGGTYIGDTLWVNDSIGMPKPMTFMYGSGRSFLFKFSPTGRLIWVNNINMTYSSDITSLKLTNNDQTLAIGAMIEGDVRNAEMRMTSDPRYFCGFDLFTPNPGVAILNTTTGLFDTAYSMSNNPWAVEHSGTCNVFNTFADGTILWGGHFRGFPRLFANTGTRTWNTMILQATDQNLRPLWRLAIGGPNDQSYRKWVDSYYNPTTGKMYLLGLCQNNVYSAVGIGSALIFPNPGYNYFLVEVSQLPVVARKSLTAPAVSIYPNPVVGSMQATIQGPRGWYQIQSTMGKNLGRVETSSAGSISLKGFASGVYFLQAERGGAPIRFVVE